MGLTVIPYRIRTPVNCDPSQRFRRLHMRAPLRSLMTPMPMEFSLPLEINTRSLRNRQSNISMSNDLEPRSFRRPSLLSSPSLVTDASRGLNDEFDQDWTVSADVFNYRLPQRRRSNGK
jgi:hypothetical protein